MKKYNYILALLATVLLSSCGYNNMVALDEGATGQWANVETAYQRRADLIPNLIETVKGAAASEKEILNSVIEARAKATSITIQADQLTPENIKRFQDAQSALSGSLSRLLATIERYPDLKSQQNFTNLMSQLEGTENRINVERRKFNEAVKVYNTTIRSFPQNIYAGWFGFEKKGYFQSEAGSEKAPKVTF